MHTECIVETAGKLKKKLRPLFGVSDLQLLAAIRNSPVCTGEQEVFMRKKKRGHLYDLDRGGEGEWELLTNRHQQAELFH